MLTVLGSINKLKSAALDKSLLRWLIPNYAVYFGPEKGILLLAAPRYHKS